MSIRRPRGYVGTHHETIGSDILAVLESLKLAEIVLGADRVERLRAVAPDGWYPIDALLEPLEFIATRLGDASLKKVGWELFRVSHEAQFRAEAKSARDLVHGIDVLYHRANRGLHIGGWQVLDFRPGHAVLEKTTPHPCVMEEGILEAGLRVLGVSGLVNQTSCFRRGADCCVFELMSTVRNERWG
jgi:hypothetical protein